MSNQNQHISIDDVRQYAAKNGVKIGKGDYNAASTNTEKQVEDKQAALATQQQQRGRLDKALDAMPQVTAAIDSLSLIGFKLLQALFSTLGIFLVLIAVVMVEIGRVTHGVALFEPNAAAAFAASFVIVMLNIMLEFLIHYVESRAGWAQSKRYAFSLRLFWQRAAYVIGFRKDWTSIEKSPAAGLRSFQLFLSIGILWLALMGSVGNMLNPDMVWHAALVDVFLYSTAGAFTVWINGLIVSALLVFGSQRLTAYIAVKAAETLPASAAAFDMNAYQEAVYAQELLARVKAKIAQQQQPAPDDTTTTTNAAQNGSQGHTTPDFLAVTPNTPNYGGNGHKPE